MNRGRLPLARWLLLAALLLGVVTAQQDDAYLERYGLAIENLERAVTALPSDAVLAREELDGAFSALLTLSREAAAGPLAAALERVVERARVAIGNASQDDLAVQAAVLEGGFQRLVFDSALRAAVEGDLPLARQRLARVGQDLGMAQADLDSLAGPDQPIANLRFDFEAGVADVIETRLAVAQELAPTSVGGAYRAMARAYGAFLLVQDSPRTQATLNQTFVEAAEALVDGRVEEATTSLGSLREGIAELGIAARARETGPSAAVPPTAPSELPDTPTPPDAEAVVEPTPDAVVEPAEEPVQEPAEPPAEEPLPEALAEVPAEELAPEAEAPEEAVPDEEAPATAVELVDETGEPLVLGEAQLALLRLEIEQELHAAKLERLSQDLAGAGVGEALRPRLSEALLEAGFERLSAAGDAVSARLVAATAAAQRGDEDSARAALRQAAERYDALLSPVVRARFADVDVETSALLLRLADEPGLRASDVAVAAAQVETARGVLVGDPEPALLTGARQTLEFWSGLPRAIVFVVIGILALIPLALLNLAFGGGNRNWQLVGVALFLLLTPVLFEGLVGLSVLLAEFAGFELLSQLPALSPFSSTVGHLVWASTALLAVIFATIGLYGICAQFGLVGRRRKVAKGARATRTGSSTESIDWDDD